MKLCRDLPQLPRRLKFFCTRKFALLLTLTMMLAYWATFELREHWAKLGDVAFFEDLSDRQRASPREEEMMRDLLRAFEYIAKNNSIPYFLYGGSLIGYYRNNSLMPWDDDMDVSMSWEHNDAFVETLNKTMPTYGMWRHSPPWHYLFKIYSKTFYSVYEPSRNFPFLDIFLHNTSGQYITIGQYKYKKNRVFPAKMGDFLGMKVPVPKDARHVIKATYGAKAFDKCVSNYRNHRNNTGLKTLTVPCRDLSFAFSFRRLNGNKTRPVGGEEQGDIFLRQTDKVV